MKIGISPDDPHKPTLLTPYLYTHKTGAERRQKMKRICNFGLMDRYFNWKERNSMSKE